MRILYGITSLLASALLFAVQPMAAKLMLPLLGGSAAVWNTALVFFQAVLLMGYASAHLLARLRLRIHAPVQAVLVTLPLALLPIRLPAGWSPPASASPALWTLVILAIMVGAPFLALCTISPTLQRWYAHSTDRDPYVLYATGNIGSLAALLAYPLLIEPHFDLRAQARAWTGAYAVFIALLCACGWFATRRARAVAETDSLAPPWRARLRWAAIAAVPSALLLGVTRHIGTDVASVPLLWVIPLALYLLTFIIAFGRPRPAIVEHTGTVTRLLVLPALLSLIGTAFGIALGLALHLGAFFAAALLAHAQLASSRPRPEQLTHFYLWMSIGGVAGGAISSLVAPIVFHQILEYPIALIFSLLMLPAAAAPSRRGIATIAAVAALCALAVALAQSTPDARVIGAVFGAACVVAYTVAREPKKYATCMALVVVAMLTRDATTSLYSTRTFFGVYRVTTDEEGRRVLLSGTTVHGVQGATTEPLSYYARSEGIGQLLSGLDPSGPPRKMAVIGLGGGALASYGRAGDQIDFYEIDSAVIDIARDPRLFTYLSESPATINTIVGDGRKTLERSDGSYDVVVLDAFSSDAIPVHLLTREALATYRARLAPRGVIAVHVSNRYFDLVPVVGRLAHDVGVRAQVYRTERSTWMALGATGLAWPSAEQAEGRVWTDSYSDLLGALSL